MTKIVAHRGLRKKGIKGNSLESIKLAVDNNVDMIEFDIQKTKDCLIVRHDTKRFGIGIKRKKYNSKKHIKLDDVLKIIPKKIPIIADIKLYGIEKELMQKLKGRKVIYFSHIKKVLLKIKQLDKKAKLGIYYIHKANFRAVLRRLRYITHFLKNAHRYSAEIIAVPSEFVTKKFMDRAKKEGFKVYVYHQAKKKHIRKAYEMGAYANEIDWVKDLSYLERLKKGIYRKKKKVKKKKS